ncbi:hypothetical protein Tco_1160940, partial [Tanacetum coccineum]
QLMPRVEIQRHLVINKSLNTLLPKAGHVKSGRIKNQVMVTDQSETAPSTFFTPTTDEVVGLKCLELVHMHKAPDPQQTPAKVIAVEGKTRILQFHFNSSTTKGAVQFTLDDVLDKRMKGA